MMTLPYSIQTPQLILRPFEASDIDDLFEFHSRPEVAQFLYWNARNRSETEKVLEKRILTTTLVTEGDTLVLAVVLAELDKVIGDVYLMWRSQEHQQCEIGFVFHPDYQGQGYATEATREVLSFGFKEFGFHRIFGRCDARNVASAKLMERLGMRREAHFIHNEIFKGEWSDELVYAILQDEWCKSIS
ncbi:MAG: GNAT family N-acetyltransferase [Chloroflexi bacterium]|nr:GNAT family N-acetyltransferase [Chloroflexota bacterium]